MKENGSAKTLTLHHIIYENEGKERKGKKYITTRKRISQ